MEPMAPSMIASIAYLVIQPVLSSLVNAISGKGVMRAGKGRESGVLPVLALSLMMKVLGKGVTAAGKGYKNTNKQF